MLRLELVQTLSQKRKKSLLNMLSTLEKKIQNNEFVLCVVYDDTDAFALLVFFCSSENLQTSITMQPPIQCPPCIDVKETTR